MATSPAGERPGRPGRKPSLNAKHTAVLRRIIREQPRPSLDEVTRELLRRAGVKVNPVTVRKALREAGIERLKPLRRSGERAAAQGSAPKRYGYTDAHRRSDGPSGMSTDLTDAEWALVADLFERDGKSGAPPRFDFRVMVNACCYALLRAAHGLCVAPAAQDVPALAGDLHVLQALVCSGRVPDHA